MNTTNHTTAALCQTLHLSAQQLDDHLIGDLSPATAAHLAACDTCTARLALAAAPMESFRSVSIAWSERRSATMPLPALPAPELVWQRRMGWAAASFVLVLGMVIGGAGRSLLTSAPAPAATEAAPAPAAVASTALPASAPPAAPEARVSEDNRMLNSIDRDLDAAVDTPATLGLEPVSDLQESRTTPTAVED